MTRTLALVLCTSLAGCGGVPLFRDGGTSPAPRAAAPATVGGPVQAQAQAPAARTTSGAQVAQATRQGAGGQATRSASGNAPARAPQPTPAPSSEYRLGAGDSIRVQVFQNPDLTVEARVSENGTINYPLIGNVQVGGLGIGETEKKIADALVRGGFLRSPQVNVNLLQVRGSQVAVLGQVQRPGRFALETSNVRASEMLAAAGGVTPTGDDQLVVTGTRNGQAFRKVIDIPTLFTGARPEEDIVLQAGDSLFVARAPVFYIYGEAQRPGPYRVERGMTVMQALAAGGGITPRGSQNRLRLSRPGPDGKMVEMTPRLTDLVQPNDVIFVRESLF